MEFIRRLFRRGIALSFSGQHMKEHRAFNLPRFPERPAKKRKVVPRHRAEIGDPHILKEHARHDQLLDAALGPADLLDHGIAHHGNGVKRVGHALFQPCIEVCRPQFGQILGHASYIFRNRHMVVVQYDDKIGLQMGGVVQRLIGHASSEGTVSDDGDHLVILPL